jgi:hypothetical protein
MLNKVATHVGGTKSTAIHVSLRMSAAWSKARCDSSSCTMDVATGIICSSERL